MDAAPQKIVWDDHRTELSAAGEHLIFAYEKLVGAPDDISRRMRRACYPRLAGTETGVAQFWPPSDFSPA